MWWVPVKVYTGFNQTSTNQNAELTIEIAVQFLKHFTMKAMFCSCQICFHYKSLILYVFVEVSVNIYHTTTALLHYMSISGQFIGFQYSQIPSLCRCVHTDGHWHSIHVDFCSGNYGSAVSFVCSCSVRHIFVVETSAAALFTLFYVVALLLAFFSVTTTLLQLLFYVDIFFFSACSL